MGEFNRRSAQISADGEWEQDDTEGEEAGGLGGFAALGP